MESLGLQNRKARFAVGRYRFSQYRVVVDAAEFGIVDKPEGKFDIVKSARLWSAKVVFNHHHLLEDYPIRITLLNFGFKNEDSEIKSIAFHPPSSFSNFTIIIMVNKKRGHLLEFMKGMIQQLLRKVVFHKF